MFEIIPSNSGTVVSQDISSSVAILVSFVVTLKTQEDPPSRWEGLNHFRVITRLCYLACDWQGKRYSPSLSLLSCVLPSSDTSHNHKLALLAFLFSPLLQGVPQSTVILTPHFFLACIEISGSNLVCWKYRWKGFFTCIKHRDGWPFDWENTWES